MEKNDEYVTHAERCGMTEKWSNQDTYCSYCGLESCKGAQCTEGMTRDDMVAAGFLEGENYRDFPGQEPWRDWLGPEDGG